MLTTHHTTPQPPLGIVGVAAKPLIGVTEGLSLMAQGVSTQITGNKETVVKRHRRAFERGKCECCQWTE